MNKYQKTYIRYFNCKRCDFKWNYKTIKCPYCESLEIKEDLVEKRFDPKALERINREDG